MDGGLPGPSPCTGALQDVTVLDLSGGVAGPDCTRLLAGLCAEVVRIEAPPKDDPARTKRLVPCYSEHGMSGLFHHLNGGKKGMTLDLQSSTGREVFQGLARRAHIVVEDFRPGAMASLGLDYSLLTLDNPGLVMTSISWFGQDGPYRDYAATDIIGLAMGGILYTCGEPGGRPVRLGGMQAEYLAGLNAAVATIAAQLRAEMTGQGQWMSVSVMQSVVSVLEATTITYSSEGVVRRRQGNRHGRGYPMTIIPCKDGYVGVMLATDADWETFARFTGIGELRDGRFRRNEDRSRLAGEIEAILQPYLMGRSREEIFNWGQEVRLPFSMVLTPAELLKDPQHLARGFFTEVEHPVDGPVLQVGAPFRMGATPWQNRRAPMPGEHTEQILRERLGLKDAEIWDLKQARAI